MRLSGLDRGSAVCSASPLFPSEAHEAKAQICCREGPRREVATRQIHATPGQFWPPTTPLSASSLFYFGAWSCSSSRFPSLSGPFSAVPFRGRPRSPSTDWPSRSWSFAFQSPAPLRRRSRKVRSSLRCKIRFARSGRGRQSISAISSTAISSRYRPHHVHPWMRTLCSWSVARPNQSVRLGSVHRCE